MAAMSLLRETEDRIDWKLVALLAAVPLVFSILCLPIPDELPTIVGWMIYGLGLGLKLGSAYVIVRKSRGGAAMMHGFLVGAGAVLLVGISKLLFSPMPFSFHVIPGFVPAMLFGGLWMVAFVWGFEKLRDWRDARSIETGQMSQ